MFEPRLHIVKGDVGVLIIFMPLTNCKESLVRRQSHRCDFFDSLRLSDELHTIALLVFYVSYPNVLSYLSSDKEIRITYQLGKQHRDEDLILREKLKRLIAHEFKKQSLHQMNSYMRIRYL